MDAQDVRIKVPVEVYSRVVGYYRPVNQWNKGKQEEFSLRKTYTTDSEPVVIEEHELQGSL